MARGLLNANIALFENFNGYGFPEILPYTEKVDCAKWIDFDSCIRDKMNSKGVHFYIDDYKFERVWNNPKKYITVLSRFDYVIQTDFSLYYDFPVALQIYNKYRNHWISSFFELNGIEMIPNISPSTPNCFDWSFLGYPKKSVVAFSDIGVSRDNLNKELAWISYNEMLKRLSPIQVLYFTRSKKNAPSECDIIEIPFLKGGA